MEPERTELNWTYQPSEFFEAPYQHRENEFELVVNAGRVAVILRVPQNPIEPELEDRISIYLRNLFLVRQLQTHKCFKLEGPSINQYTGDRIGVTLRCNTEQLVVSGGLVDIRWEDASGNVVIDTKAKRIATEKFS